MPQYSDEAYEANRELLTMIRNISEEKNVTPTQISLAWMLCKKPWIVPIPGTRKKGRMIKNAGAGQIGMAIARRLGYGKRLSWAIRIWKMRKQLQKL